MAVHLGGSTCTFGLGSSTGHRRRRARAEGTRGRRVGVHVHARSGRTGAGARACAQRADSLVEGTYGRGGARHRRLKTLEVLAGHRRSETVEASVADRDPIAVCSESSAGGGQGHLVAIETEDRDAVVCCQQRSGICYNNPSVSLTRICFHPGLESLV